MWETVRERVKGWKTLLFGTLLTLATSLLLVLDSLQAVDLAPLLPARHSAAIMAGLGVVTILLRVVTSGRIGEKR